MQSKASQDKLTMIFVTCGSDEEAGRLAEGLVREHLAACVNIAPIHSVFEWQGKIENQAEWLLIIKSLRSLFEAINKFIHDNHSYDLPELIAVDISESSSEYASWIKSLCERNRS